MDDNDTRIPVTLLTGFLGAGKTTLLNHLTRDRDAGRLAVIMNEFGAAGLDHDLMEASVEEIILMESGCLCCTFRGDIARTLGALMAKRQRGDVTFDRVVIETTGIADPAPILHTLFVDDLIGHYYRMDGVVTLADAATGSRTLQEHSEAFQQVAMADLIVVSKTDLASDAECARFERQLTAINASARRLRAEQGRVPPGALFDLTGLRADVTADDISHWLGKVTSAQDADPQKPVPTGTAPQARHSHRITSASIEVTEPIPPSVFDFWIDTLIALKGPDILRMKGIVHVDDLDWPFVFHGVQHIFDAPVHLENWTGDDKTSRVVVIARNMEKEELEANIALLRMQPKDVETSDAGMTMQTLEMPS